MYLSGFKNGWEIVCDTKNTYRQTHFHNTDDAIRIPVGKMRAFFVKLDG